MELFLYLILFVMGTFFGSFFTLAVYRIPLKQDILYTHSYCPSCKHKLNIIDLFPVFSYIALRGKCRYCGNKIRIRYLLLEVLTGLVFLLYALSFRFSFLFFDFYKIIGFVFGVLYFVGLFIIAGIDKESVKIQFSLLVYGFVVSLGYIIYVCTSCSTIVYSYAIYLLVMLILLVVNYVLLHRFDRCSYVLQILTLLSYMLIFSNVISFILTAILSIIVIVLNFIINKFVKKGTLKIPIGFWLCVCNIICVIFLNFMVFSASLTSA